MDLTNAEMFLLAWALLATVIAVWFHTKYGKAMRGGVVMCGMLISIAKREATIERQADGKVVFENEETKMTLGELTE
jgi:hypothetical protein